MALFGPRTTASHLADGGDEDGDKGKGRECQHRELPKLPPRPLCFRVSASSEADSGDLETEERSGGDRGTERRFSKHAMLWHQGFVKRERRRLNTGEAS